jgi:hypothetical protein
MVSGVLTSPPFDDGTLGAATEGPVAHSLLLGSQVPPEPLQQVSCGKPFFKHCSLRALLASRGSATVGLAIATGATADNAAMRHTDLVRREEKIFEGT